MDVQTRVAGIPCIARVTHFYKQRPWRGSAHSCPSDMDWYGFTECEFQILDRRGRPAPWLERKLTDDEVARIEEEITESMTNDD